MFSFFKSSKKPVESPDSSDEVVAPSPSQQQEDDFIMIEGRNRRQPLNPYQQQSGGVYPSLDNNTSAYGGNVIGPHPSSQTAVRRQDSNANFHYLQGVPFKLSSEIDTGADSTEVQRIQVDEILASLTRMMEMTADYEFKLEQSTLSHWFLRWRTKQLNIGLILILNAI